MCYADSIIERINVNEFSFLLEVYELNEEWKSLKYITSGRFKDALIEAIKILTEETKTELK